MAISYVGKGTEAAIAGSGTTVAPNIPGSLVDKDILIVGAISGADSDTFTWPSGYTEGSQGGVTGGDFGWAWKRSNGTDSGTETVTRSGTTQQFMAVIFAMRGCRETGDPFDTKDNTYSSPSTTSNSQEIITTVDNCRVLCFMMCENDNETVSLNNYTREFEFTNQIGNDSEAVLFYQDKATAGTVSSEITSTRAASQRAGVWTFDLVPAPDGTIDQEGFRFYNDDGSESAATARQNQDVVDSIAKDINFRLRALLNTAGDVPTKQYQLEYKENGDSDVEYRKVKL